MILILIKLTKYINLFRLGEVAGAKMNTDCQIPVTADLFEENREKLRDNKPGKADFSDENRPINLVEKGGVSTRPFYSPLNFKEN